MSNLKQISRGDLNKVFTNHKLYVSSNGSEGEVMSLSGYDLRYCDFSGLYLKDANFSGSDLTMSSFKGSNLKGANLTDATLDRTNFEYCNRH